MEVKTADATKVITPTRMQFEYGGELFRIQFEHGTDANGFSRKHTACTILRHNGDDWLLFSTGYAKCVASDQYCKETGRKLALMRATKEGSAKHLEPATEADRGPGREGITDKWVSHFPADWDCKAWSRAAWAAYLGRRA